VGDTGRDVNVDTHVNISAGVGLGITGEVKTDTSGASASLDAAVVAGLAFHTGIGVSGAPVECPESEEDQPCKK